MCSTVNLVGTPQQPYVANPDHGSIHNFGLAIDLTLLDASGQQLDMGTGFDNFTDAARIDHEAALVASGARFDRRHKTFPPQARFPPEIRRIRKSSRYWGLSEAAP